MRILFIDTAAHLAKVFLIEDGKRLSQYEDDGEKTHASNLPLCVSNALESAGKTLADIDVFAVTNGPGSYTGLRIGIAYAKALAYGNGKPLVCVNTLDYLARSCTEKADVLVSLLDARNTLCFFSTYMCVRDGSGTRTVPFRVNASDYCDFICGIVKGAAEAGKRVVFTGDGAFKNREKIEELVPGALFTSFGEATGTAEGAFALVSEKWEAAGENALQEFTAAKAAAEYCKPVHITYKRMPGK